MRLLDNNIQAFFALVRAGLWETDVQLSQLGGIDFSQVLKFAEEQSVVGLVAAGLEHVADAKVPKDISLQFVGQTLQLEQRNVAMNHIIGELIDKMREAGIYTLLVKGQGIAQCYERPLWRSSGDIDFYLSDDNFLKAREFFKPLVTGFIPADEKSRRIEMIYTPWIIELHANQRITLSVRINRVLDDIHRDLFLDGNVRSWDNNGTTIFLPAPDNDVLIVFTHFLNHFYKEGIGLRQICDWCRLLWSYGKFMNHSILESRIRRAGLMTEWKAFAAFVVDYLGMPSEAMPFYSADERWKHKADRICSFIMEVGNFGHNRDRSYYDKYPYEIRKAISFGRRVRDLFGHARIFPLDSLRFFPYIIFNGVRSAIRGE